MSQGFCRLVGAQEVRDWRRARRNEGRTVALVPTMGALHEGHLALLDAAAAAADLVLISIFVNPTQFGPGEDYDAYPRDLSLDETRARSRGAAAVFAPDVREMYPVDQTIWVDPGPLADRLCGLSRPGHFRGVLTVVAKLFGIVEPDVAVFGRKDFQQSVLVRRMALELGFGVRIETVPTVREPDGLARSSRNAYLTGADRPAARSLSESLVEARHRFASGERDPGRLAAAAREWMTARGAEVEYAEIVDPQSLERVGRAEASHVCAVAARVAGTRLIDNETLGGPSPLDRLSPERA